MRCAHLGLAVPVAINIADVPPAGALAAGLGLAVAAVLANQLVSSFIPAVPGWFATKNLMNDGYL